MDGISASISGVLVVLVLSAFLKIFTSLNLLRFGLGLEGGGFGLVIAGASLALTLVVMPPEFMAATGGIAKGFGAQSEEALEKNARPFLEKYAHTDAKERFLKIHKTIQNSNESTIPEVDKEERGIPFPVLMCAFVFSQLKEAFQIGLFLLIPFVLLDLIVVNVLMALGVTQMPATLVSLPLKLLLFFAVDGWTLVTDKLLKSFIGD